MANADDSVLTIDEIKKEPSENCSDAEDKSSCGIDAAVSVKGDSGEKETSDGTKSEDDMQGYDTRSEAASSVTSDSDSADEGSSKSFDVKRKRQSRLASHITSETNRKNDSISPLKKNSIEYLSQLSNFFRDARFFVIKSSNSENIVLSKAKGVWATLPQNQIKLSEAFRSSQNVILIFSAKESGKFSGFARLATGVDRSISPVPWVVPAELTPNLLKGTFRIDWICRNDLPFSFTTTLYNAWNCNKPVKIARDGQEVEPRVGEKLCRLFPEDESVDIKPILRKSKEAAKSRPVTHMHEMAVEGLYTAKYRAKMLHHKSMKDRMPFPQRVHDAGRVLKHYKNKSIKGFPDMKHVPLRNRVMNSIESYMKRFGPSFRPPLPASLPFLPPLPPPPHGGEMFPSQFGPIPFPQPPPLPRYYDPAPGFSHFSKMGPLPPPKTIYDRSVEEFLRRTRENEFLKKDNRSRRKQNESKARRPHYRDRR